MTKVALLPWGDAIEDYLDAIGQSVDDFAVQMSGGWLFGYADALRTAGVDACVICVSERARRPRRIVNPHSGLATVVLPAPGAVRALRRLPRLGERAGRFMMSERALAGALRAEGASHVICQEYEYHRLATALAAARAAGARTFASFQGGVPSASAREALGRGRTIRALDGLIIASAAEAERVSVDHGVPPGRIFRIPNPLDTDAWSPADRVAARRELGLPDGATIAICHTRIDVHRKGLDVMMDAWRKVAAERPGRDVRLHLIGTGSGTAQLEAMLEATPVPGLRWTGYTTDRAAMRRELAAADFYVSASRNEGFAVAPLEAMACGLPVILSTAPGAAEILPRGEADGGVIVPSGDADALAGAVARMAVDAPARARMGAAARSRAEAFVALPSVGRQLARALAGEDADDRPGTGREGQDASSAESSAPSSSRSRK